MTCRFCGRQLTHEFIDLASAPPSNAYLSRVDLRKPELCFPLKLYVCDSCWLVQTEDYAGSDQLFGPDYAYFSSTSTSWLSHAAEYSEMICTRLGLDKSSYLIEIASNDGYLLKNFVKAGIPCLGIEPTDSTAAAAESVGVPVIREFFGLSLAHRLAGEGRQADLVVGNNVYAHVPDINDFTAGLKVILKPGGTVTLEFPHLMCLIEHVQFDTIYHEHYSYLSLYAVSRVFEQAGLRVYDVEKISTHGGSLRVYGCHHDDVRLSSDAVGGLLAEEDAHGLRDLATYQGFQVRADQVKDGLLSFLLAKKREGKRVMAYGAAAKGNTLLNYAGVKPDLLPMVCDAALSKQGKFMPGSRIPIVKPDLLREYKPDYVLILPWNIKEEIVANLDYIYEWGGQFVLAVPAMCVT
ncbi:MAG: class I SAM-dependent methyltransferase [Chloroflexota bacterium]